MANPHLASAGRTLLQGIGTVFGWLAGIILAVSVIGYLSLKSGVEPSTLANGLFGVVGVILYFTPTLVAKQRAHSKYSAILILNVFLGWTFLGWVGALVWAHTENNPPAKPARPEPPAAQKPAPRVAQRVERRAMVNCRNPVCSRVYPSTEAECPGCGTKSPQPLTHHA